MWLLNSGFIASLSLSTHLHQIAMHSFHENLNVRIGVIVFQIIFGPKEAGTRDLPSCSLGEDLGALNGHDQMVKHDIHVAVLRAEGLLGHLPTQVTAYGAIYSGNLAKEEVTVQMLITVNFLIPKPPRHHL